jgi:hypothetical protein
MDADMDAVLFAGCPDRTDALISEAFDRVGSDVDLQVEEAHAVTDSRLDPVLNSIALAEIDADFIAEA